MPDSPEVPEFYSTVPISVPVVVPEAEDVIMNGFVWSADFGLLLGIADSGKPAVDELFNLRTPPETFSEENQGLRADFD